MRQEHPNQQSTVAAAVGSSSHTQPFTNNNNMARRRTTFALAACMTEIIPQGRQDFYCSAWKQKNIINPLQLNSNPSAPRRRPSLRNEPRHDLSLPFNCRLPAFLPYKNNNE